jgi:iron complex transport system substrate-binding protein
MKYCLFLFLLFFACHSIHREGTPRGIFTGTNQYALGFSVDRSNPITRLTVRNPWEKARNITFEYYLVPMDQAIPDSIADRNIIRTPVKRVICLSTSHLAFLDAMNELDKVTGISGSPYISNPAIKKGIQEGRIKDVGYGSNLNYEEIIRQKSDLVLVYGVDSEISGFLNKFQDLGIPAVIMAEYLESTPLGKAEWMKFTASFFGKDKMADSLFSGIERRYLQLTGVAKELKEKPEVIVGLPYRDNWWIPGGASYLASLIEDAGGNYMGRINDSHESYVVSMEDAIQLFSGADIWINTGMVTRKSEILTSEERFSKLSFFESARIFNNNNRSTPAGGMDFWESGTIQPDVLLGDLIRIFHPGVLPQDTLIYYREIR